LPAENGSIIPKHGRHFDYWNRPLKVMDKTKISFPYRGSNLVARRYCDWAIRAPNNIHIPYLINNKIHIIFAVAVSFNVEI
jgi:hypothetical protein